MDIRAAEISAILKDQIKEFRQGLRFPKSDRCCPRRRHCPRLRLDNVQAARWSIRERHPRHGAEPRTDNVASYFRRRPRDQGRSDRQAHPRIVDTPWQGLLGRVVDALGIRSTQGPIQSSERKRVDVKAPALIRANRQRADGNRLKAIDALIPIGRGRAS